MKIIFSKNYVNCYSIVDFAIIDDYNIFIIIYKYIISKQFFIFLFKKIFDDKYYKYIYTCIYRV